MSVDHLQKKAFQQYEADQWFSRNRSVIENYNGEKDLVVKVIQQYNLKPLRVLEIGCSAGYRLDHIKKMTPSTQVVGVDLSAAAITEGKKQFSSVEFHLGGADDLSALEDSSFDLVIVGFVLYVIDRASLLKVVSEIDRVLSDKGLLINIDFFSETALKNDYHHIKEFKAYSFKQRYEDIFLATQMYQLIHKLSFNHNVHSLDATDDYFNKCSVTLLKKDIYASYR